MKGSKKLLYTFLFIAIIQIASAQKNYPATKYAIINTQIVDMEEERIFPGVLLVKQGKIEAINPSYIPGDYQVIDMENSFIMPGMIDVHTHLNSLASARRALLSGITTVRSASVSSFQDVSIQKMVEAGQIPGPDMVPCGVYVTPVLGETVLADPRLGMLMDSIDTESELRELVRINIDRGARVIKTRGTERAGLPETDPRKQTYTQTQLEWVVDEAANYNVPVMIHAHGNEGALAAIHAGAKSIEHGTYLTTESLQLMKEKDVFFVPTFITLVDLVEPGGDYDNPVIKMRGEYMLPKSEKAIQAAIQLGVKIATGADNRYTAETTSHVSMEVEHFMRLGMKAWDALKTTTTNAAELLGLSSQTGRIKPGFEADLIAIPDNPITDTKALQDVVLVMSNGKLVLNRLPFSK